MKHKASDTLSISLLHHKINCCKVTFTVFYNLLWKWTRWKPSVSETMWKARLTKAQTLLGEQKNTFGGCWYLSHGKISLKLGNRLLSNGRKTIFNMAVVCDLEYLKISYLVMWLSSSPSVLLSTKFHHNPTVFHRDMSTSFVQDLHEALHDTTRYEERRNITCQFFVMAFWWLV